MTNDAHVEDRLWVPLLTHYREASDRLIVDVDRMVRHLRAIQPAVRQFMLAGSTGDGWELTWEQVRQLIALSRRPDAFLPGAGVLFGVLRPTTEEVVAWVQRIEAAFAEGGPPAGRYHGLVICPPVDASATQERILDHYRRVLEATKSRVAVYQLPQVTHCSIAPETLRTLASGGRVTLFKDTSGTDTVASAGAIAGVTMVRGAEGAYLQALRPAGSYDGWLLSSGNVFGGTLRRILTLQAGGACAHAQRLSDIMTAAVNALFDLAGSLPFGNAFSNANRAADHLCAIGAEWRTHPLPLTVSGDRLPETVIADTEDVLRALPMPSREGYLMEHSDVLGEGRTTA